MKVMNGEYGEWWMVNDEWCWQSLGWRIPHAIEPSETLETCLEENILHSLTLDFAIDAQQEEQICEICK